MFSGLDHAAVNLIVALFCGALIGSERQVRQRTAGLRTNALVAVGAASFVIFAGLFTQEVSPTRVAAQIVSGIGFLGAGIIFRDGFNVHGLNTAATLWCSAGVGMMAGAGHWPHALLLTAIVIFINLGLRPLVKWIKRKAGVANGQFRQFRITMVGDATKEGELRAFILRNLAVGGLHLSQMQAEVDSAAQQVELTVLATAEGLTDAVVDQTLHRLAAEPGLVQVRWEGVE